MAKGALITIYRRALEQMNEAGIWAGAPYDQGHIIKPMAQAILETAPDDPLALKFLGETLMEEEEYERALPFLQKSFAQRPGDHSLPYSLGITHYHLKNYQAAIPFLEPVAQNPQEVYAHIMLAYALYKTGQYARALPYYRTATENLEDLIADYAGELRELGRAGLARRAAAQNNSAIIQRAEPPPYFSSV
jgi:tetratricopeptide (TPR) repeat protein